MCIQSMSRTGKNLKLKANMDKTLKKNGYIEIRKSGFQQASQYLLVSVLSGLPTHGGIHIFIIVMIFQAKRIRRVDVFLVY